MTRKITLEEFATIALETLQGTAKGLLLTVDTIKTIAAAIEMLHKHDQRLETPKDTRSLRNAMLAKTIVDKLTPPK